MAVHTDDHRPASLTGETSAPGSTNAPGPSSAPDPSGPTTPSGPPTPPRLRRVAAAQLRPTASALDLLGAAIAAEPDGLPLVADDTRVVVAYAAPPAPDTIARLAAIARRVVLPVLADAAPLTQARLATFGAGASTSAALAGPGTLDELLLRLLEVEGSDLHLTAGAPPKARVHGSLQVIEPYPALDSETIKRLVYGVLDERQVRAFEDELELDTAYAVPGASRFRMNVFRQRGCVGAVLRTIPYVIPDFDTLGLPSVVKRFADLPRGLVLVTGPTGSGKSTTLASLLDIVNRTKPVHIISCEDPIEFVHQHRMAIVNQREVGQDTRSFSAALKRALREDPDVILVGEMRDLETIHMALTAAETGHLVLGTLHTQSAPQTVDRVVDVFPPEQQGQVRVMLAASLQAVVTQQLVPTSDGKGRAVASEVLVVTPAVRNLIREGKGHQIPTQMQAGAQHGMVTMDQSLAGLVRAKRISLDIALERAANPEDLRNLLGLRG
jgi:twitching motility protein PilT